MRTIIKSKNFKPTEAIYSYINRRLGRFSRFTEEKPARITLMSNKIEVQLKVDGTTVKAESEHEDLYVAIDLVTDKLDRQLRKQGKHFTRDSLKVLSLYEVSHSKPLEDKESSPQVIKRKSFAIKPMSTDEAIMQMELLGHTFFMFRNSETNTMCVLYKRKDNMLGLIEEGID